MTLAQRLAELLGQPETASEDDLLAAIPPPGAGRDAALQAQMAEIGTALGVAGGDGAAVLAAAQARATADPVEMAAMQAELTTVTTAFTALQSEIRRDKAVAFVDAAIAAARPGVKRRRASYIARHMEDPAETEATILAIPSFGPVQVTAQTALSDGTATDLTALNAEQQGRVLHDRAIAWQSEQKAKGLSVALFDAITHIKKDIQL